MRELPSGTVTFLFTDIEGSTKLLHELGAERYADALEEHRRVLREAFARHGGVEVDTQGDAFFVAFSRASDAAAAAAEAVGALGDGVVSVRVGLHTGEPLVRDGGYVGPDVHLAARVMSAAHGGQVLASQPTVDLIPDGDVRDLGVHRLEDVGELRLFQLGDGTFPPLRTLNNTNLPAPPDLLLGRKRELADLLRLLRVEGVRLLTLTGPGGIGKTRLALELARDLVPAFEHGAWFADVSAIRDPGLVVPAIAGALGAKTTLAEHVADRELLLVVDNLEQVVDAAPELGALLGTCPRLQLVVTSRELLRVAGEREYPLRPLGEAPAVELFRGRAAARADYHAVAALCERLDNLPLAIELAAARTRSLSFEELRGRLDQRLPLLTRGRRDAPERQRTLRATIAWSYDLCDEPERRLFRRLAVFEGGWTLVAAETVCDADVDTLAALVEKSLVRTRRSRYAMLETIREFALDELSESGERDALRRRHAQWVLERALASHLNTESEGEQDHLLLRDDRDNVRAALAWALGEGEVELGLEIAVALENGWVVAQPLEGYRWLRAFLDGGPEIAPPLRAHAVRVCGSTTYITGDYELGTHHYEEALAAYRELGDERGIAVMLFRLAFEARRVGDHRRARRLAEEALSIEEGVRLPKLESQALLLLGVIEFDEGHHDEGLALLERAADLARETGFTWWRAGALVDLADRALRIGRVDDGARRAGEALELSQRIGDRLHTVWSLALVAIAAPDAERSGLLWGAIESEAAREPIGPWEAARERYGARLQHRGDERFERGRREGRRLALDEAVTKALEA